MMNRCAIASIAAAVFAMAICAVASAAPVLTSQSGWSWGNPRPQGNELRAVDFAGGRGYAVGAFGTVLRTDDGGTTWSGVRTGLLDDLSKLRVIDANTFLAGGGCTLLRSDDSGQTLRRLRFNPSATCGSPLAAMHFATKDIGYLVRSDGSVLRTEDGGARFASRTALPATGGGPPNDAWFTSPENGVVVTGSDTLGRIYRTTDGGSSWKDVATSGALRGLFFVSATTGYAVGQNAVLKTVDGGATWTPTEAGVPAPLRSVRCGDELHCVVIAGNGLVMHTDDGFETLNSSGIEPPPGGASIALPIPGLSASYASATRVAVVGRRGDAATSDNAGRTFTPIGTTLQGAYNRLRLTSQSTVFAPGTAGSVARSTDAGATWSRVGAPTTNDVVDVAFPTSDLGYAVDTDGAVFRTDNGGTSWAILGDPGVRPNSITASGNGDVVMLIGPRGVMRSANGGANFDQVEAAAVGPTVALDDVDRTSDGGVYVFGGKAIAFTSDEGAKWSVVRRPGRSSIIDADFVDRKVGYVLTADRRLWFTTNRGSQWRELLTIGYDTPYSLAFADRNNGYVAVNTFAGDELGWVLRTSDGGASWRPQLLSSGAIGGRHGLVAAPGDIAHALIGGSDLFRTDSGGDAGATSTLTLTTKTKRLRRKGKVRVDGKLTPAAPGARVEVKVRELGSNRWSRQIVTVRSDGTFSTNWTVKRSSSFLAQWAGDQALNSDGSPALRVTVGR
jgi:photosystem II stability/assembly factor-like uncharacterized protein